jgi:hypothetical protein
MKVEICIVSNSNATLTLLKVKNYLQLLKVAKSNFYISAIWSRLILFLYFFSFLPANQLPLSNGVFTGKILNCEKLLNWRRRFTLSRVFGTLLNVIRGYKILHPWRYFESCYSIRITFGL